MALLCALSFQANAAVFLVDDPNDAVDAVPGDGTCAGATNGCTLRAAVMEATALAGADSITLLSGTMTLSLVGVEDAGFLGDLDILDDLTVQGSASVVDGDGADGIFEVHAGRTLIREATLDDAQRGLVNRADAVLEQLTVKDMTIVGVENASGARLEASDLELEGNGINTGIALGAQFENAGVATVRRAHITQGSAGIVNSGRLLLDSSAINLNHFRFLTNTAGGITNSGVLRTRNVMVFDNVAGTTGPTPLPGGLLNTGQAWLNSATFFRNVGDLADSTAGTGTTYATNSIFIATPFGAVNCAVPLTTLDYNAEDGEFCGLNAANDLSSSPIAVTPDLMAAVPILVPNSVALDSGRPRCLISDAQGFMRPAGNGCDRGAIELGSARACGNGLDDDGDGLIDALDPGCADAADPLEIDVKPDDLIVSGLGDAPGMGLMVDTLTVVDPVSGRQSLLGVGGGLFLPTGIVFDPDGSIVVVGAEGTMVRVDPQTGEQTVIAWEPVDAAHAIGLVRQADGSYAASVRVLEAVIEIDPNNGAVSTIGTATQYFNANGLAADPNGTLYATAPGGIDKLFRKSGSMMLPLTGTTPALTQSRGIAIQGNTAYIADSMSGQQRIVSVDLSTEVVTDITADGVFNEPRGVAIERDGSLVVGDWFGSDVVRVNPDSGEVVDINNSEAKRSYYLGVVPAPEPCVWTRYADQSRFVAKTGADVFDFSTVAVDPNGLAAFSNGADLGPFNWTSLSLPADVALSLGSGPLGLDGTLLVVDVPGIGKLAAPGGAGGQNDPESNDDFRLDLESPATWAGVSFRSQTYENGEWIEFRDPNDQPIARFDLTNQEVGSGPRSFVGIEMCSGLPEIASIVVNEGQSIADDITFSHVLYELVVPPDPPLCGDLDLSEAIDMPDVDRFRVALSDPSMPFSAAELDQCSVIGGATGCDIADVVVLRRKIAGLLPEPEQLCPAATP